MAYCEIVGGPRDGEVFAVPGALPPERIRILITPAGPVTTWHPSRGDIGVGVVECILEDTVTPDTRHEGNWRYLWPRHGGDTVAPQ
jgi:hypothetical protein